jgi:precorrin-2 dehydrogenase/sirohydrochlorin ferrochelatase
MKYYPAYLDLRDRPCLVIGGGVVAERKALGLVEAGADVTVISPTLTPQLQTLATSGKIIHHNKLFDEKDLAGACLVVAATDSGEVNTRVAQTCKKNNMLVNVVAPPEESTFIVPSVVDRGELLISISTSGTSPALSKKIRQELEAQYGAEYGLFLERFSAVRKRVLEEIPDEQKRRTVFQAIVDSDVLDLLRQGKTQEADKRMMEIAGLISR